MKKMKVDLAVIGGGPAGMAAALEGKICRSDQRIM